MCSAMQAAARDMWNAVRNARGRAALEGANASLCSEDFDGEVEYWYR